MQPVTGEAQTGKGSFTPDAFCASSILSCLNQDLPCLCLYVSWCSLYCDSVTLLSNTFMFASVLRQD